MKACTVLSSLSEFLECYAPDIVSQERIAVAVSGGGDSMALAHALSQIYPTLTLHFLTIDHGLRSESAQEAQQVKEWLLSVKDLVESRVHKTLHWSHDGVSRKVQEEARHARYALLLEYCHKHAIKTLFVGHHRDDVVETFLMRLSSGSGLDGLASIAPVVQKEDVSILRPFYACGHEDILTYCRAHDVPWIEDPSNEKDKYERVRFRKAQKFLEEEGLTSERLSKTIGRIARAREALGEVTDSVLNDLILDYKKEMYHLDLEKLYALHSEFKIRVLSSIIRQFNLDAKKQGGYPPRLEKIENIASDLSEGQSFRKRTFAGCVFSALPKENMFVIEKESRE